MPEDSEVMPLEEAVAILCEGLRSGTLSNQIMKQLDDFMREQAHKDPIGWKKMVSDLPLNEHGKKFLMNLLTVVN